MKVIGNLLGALFRAFFRTVFGAIIGAAIGGGATLAVFHQMSNPQTSIWPLPGGLAEIFAIVVAVLSCYAVGLTVLAAAAVRGLVEAGEGVVKEATTAGNLAEDAIKHL
jgi:hypothetical protein